MMYNLQEGLGVAKKRLTGNQRKERRVAQALKLRISDTELLLLRRAKMAEWQMEKHSLHFRLLSMRLGPTPNQATSLQNVQRGTTNH